MGDSISRINPKIISRTQKDFLVNSVRLIISAVVLLPVKKHNKKGAKPYDYRILLAICAIKTLFKKTYSDYEIETRRDPRICLLFGMSILPGKSTIQAYLKTLKMKDLMRFNSIILCEWSKRKLNLMIDSSGIKIIGRSVWFCIRIKEYIKKRDCDKAHLAVCSDVLFIMNWKITRGKRNDCPFFAVLLKPFKLLGIVLGDKGYSSRKNFQLAADKRGCAFIPFKKGATASPKGRPAWKAGFWIWTNLNSIYQSIYHQRSKIESVFHALKERFGDKLYGRGAISRRKEIALRFIAYNVRLIIFHKYAQENNLNLWVRA